MIKNPGEITLDDALNICKEALKKGRELDLMPLTVTVVDVAGVIRATMAERFITFRLKKTDAANFTSNMVLTRSFYVYKDFYPDISVRRGM